MNGENPKYINSSDSLLFKEKLYIICIDPKNLSENINYP